MQVSSGTRGDATSFELFFQENYGTLKRWAFKITSNDQGLAEDLLHDVYVRFSGREDNVDDLESVHAYMYKVIKNSFISHLRWRTRQGLVQFPAADIETDLHARLSVDPRSFMKTHEDLMAICSFACARKSTSISASILILRFIHGYYSSEVARVVNRSQNAVEARLVKARREAGEYLLNSLEIDLTRSDSQWVPHPIVKPSRDLVTQLRKTVFSFVEGSCLTDEKLRRAYRQAQNGIDRDELSHLVSCSECLDRVNNLLHLPVLSERHPLDSLGSRNLIEVLERNRSMAAGSGM